MDKSEITPNEQAVMKRTFAQPSDTIIIKKLPIEMRAENVMAFFEGKAKVEDAKVLTISTSTRGGGLDISTCARVRFSTAVEASVMKETYHGTTLLGTWQPVEIVYSPFGPNFCMDPSKKGVAASERFGGVGKNDNNASV